MVRVLLFILAVVSYLFLPAQGQNADSLRTVLSQQNRFDRVPTLHQLILNVWLNFPAEAMNYGLEALELSRAENDSVNISKSLRLIAGVFYYKGEYDSSLTFNQKALDIGLSIGDSTLINNVYNNIGLLYYELGSYQTALEYLLKSIALKERTKDYYGLETTLNNIGLVYDRVLDYEEARRNFRNAFDASIQNDNYNVRVYSLNNMGITYRKEQRFKLARLHFDSALRIAKEIKNYNWGAVSLRNIGEIHRYTGRYDSARIYYESSLEDCIKISDRKGISESYNFLAKLSLDEGNPALAKEYLDKSHALANQVKLRHQLLENLRLYASIHLLEKDNEKVIQNQFKYLDLQDSLFRDAIYRNLTLVPIKIKEAEDRTRLSKQQAELENRALTNRLYAIMLIGAIPILTVLIVLLRKNDKAFRELRANNEQLKKTQNLLVTSEKMASLGVLAAGVGHEINNPLNYIKNGVEGLTRRIKRENKETVDSIDKYVDIINEGVDRASKIVRSLGHFSRAGLDENEVSNVENIIDNCLTILTNKTKNLTLKKSFNASNMLVFGNESKLHQVFMNLILNAAQATNGHGKIDIATSVENDVLKVIVEDNGEGIDEKNLLKISDPFFTTKPPGEGTGLGLFITYAIIEEHQGQINLQSEVNKGTRFEVMLPLYHEK